MSQTQSARQDTAPNAQKTQTATQGVPNTNDTSDINDTGDTSDTPTKCAHCQLVYPLSKLTRSKRTDSEGRALYFCCNGCESVYFLLQNSGFGGFYERLGENVLSPIGDISDAGKNASQTSANAKSYLDEPSFLQKHAKPAKIASKNSSHDADNTPNLLEISAIIEGIHCAACVWLNENVLGLKPGIHQARINYTNNKAKIIFDPSIIKLSEIFALIESIGYRAHIYDPSLQEKQLLKAQKSFFNAFVVGVFCTMSIMMVAIAQYAGYFRGMSASMKDVLNLVSCLLATPVLFFTGRVFFSGAYHGLKNKYIGMDFLVAFGASLTFIYSIYAAITRSGETYFESVAMIILFVFSGKFLEMKAKSAAGDSIDRLHTILPNVVDVESEGKIIQKEVKSLQIGDIVRMKPGEMLPCDGVALQSVLLDMQSISGESMPVAKSRGEELLSGSIALESAFAYEVRQSYESSMMSKIINLLEESLNHRPKIQNLANALSKYFSRVVLFIALCGFCGWWVASGDAQQALIITISVIVISCPCALALATPIASVVGIERAYKAGLIFKEARFLESLARASIVVFDKTGTLTSGKHTLVSRKDLQALDKAGENLLANFVSLSAHPISKAIYETLTLSEPIALEAHSQVDSRGMSAVYRAHKGYNGAGGAQDGLKNVRLLGGSLAFLADNGVDISSARDLEDVDSESMSVFGYSVGGALVAVFYLQDTIKSDALALINYLKSQNKQIALISGDREGVVASVARALGIEQWHANMLPEQKVEFIKTKRKEAESKTESKAKTRVKSGDAESKGGAGGLDSGVLDSVESGAFGEMLHDKGGVVMIGDGLNDILAIQNAQVGISMGAGSDIAIAQSDVVVLDDTLKSVQKAFEIAAQTYSRIKQNILLSIIYNALLIPLALAGFVIPLIAALSMSVSSLIVVGNSMRKPARK